MRLETAFRLSSYLTLGLACVCLGYAEQSFLGGIIFWEASLLLLLPIAFWAEGRVSLPIWAANVLGVFIAGGMGLWVASRIIGSDDPMVDIAPWPASLLPYLGPLLMVLMMVKLFRPKQAGDFWMLHAIGLMEVGLGCVLAHDLAFGGLLVIYLLSVTWCLTLFSLRREEDAGAAARRITAM